MSAEVEDGGAATAEPRARSKKKKKARPRGPEGGGATKEPSSAQSGPSRPAARPPSPSAERSIRRTLVGSAAVALAGLALVGTGPSLPGMVLCIAGVLGLVVSIHRFGRLGPEGG